MAAECRSRAAAINAEPSAAEIADQFAGLGLAAADRALDLLALAGDSRPAASAKAGPACTSAVPSASQNVSESG